MSGGSSTAHFLKTGGQTGGSMRGWAWNGRIEEETGWRDRRSENPCENCGVRTNHLASSLGGGQEGSGEATPPADFEVVDDETFGRGKKKNPTRRLIRFSCTTLTREREPLTVHSKADPHIYEKGSVGLGLKTRSHPEGQTKVGEAKRKPFGPRNANEISSKIESHKKESTISLEMTYGSWARVFHLTQT